MGSRGDYDDPIADKDTIPIVVFDALLISQVDVVADRAVFIDNGLLDRAVLANAKHAFHLRLILFNWRVGLISHNDGIKDSRSLLDKRAYANRAIFNMIGLDD